MTLRLVLARHGRSAHRGPAWHARIGADDFARWRAAYDAAGLAAGEAAPAALRAVAARAGAVVASDLPRAGASAALLGGTAPRLVSPLLREVDLPVPAWPGARLPLGLWLVGARAGWARGTLPSPEPPPAARARAREGARWLADLAAAHGTVVAVTHGAFRPLLAAALRADGWRGRGWLRHGHWSTWVLVGPCVSDRSPHTP